MSQKHGHVGRRVFDGERLVGTDEEDGAGAQAAILTVCRPADN